MLSRKVEKIYAATSQGHRLVTGPFIPKFKLRKRPDYLIPDSYLVGM